MKTKLLLIVLLGGLISAARSPAADDAATNAVPATDAAAPGTNAVAPDASGISGDQVAQPPPDTDVAPAPAPAPTPVPAPVLQSPPAPLPATMAAMTPMNTNLVTPGQGLIFNFHGARLDEVLKYLSDAAGFIILPKVDVSGKVDVYSAQPLNKDEAVALLQKILTDKGYAVVRDDRTLTIIRSGDAKNHDIVRTASDPVQVPNNEEVATVIIPLHSLNAVQASKDLESLKPSGMTVNANDVANSLVATGTQTNIRHFIQIINALDSVNTSSATVRVYHLKYADSKATASLLKDLFPSADANNRNAGGNAFGRFRGGGGGGGFPGFPFGGGGGGGGGNNDNPSDTGHTPTAKVSAVSDDHSNSLIVSAPDILIPDIDGLVKDLDNPVDETTEVRVFHLKHADPGEMADLLTQLFPSDTGSTDATRQQVRFPFPFGGQQQNNTATATSDRAKKLSQVVAVPDRRTSSLVVTAGKDLLPQIKAMIDELDQSTAHVYSPHIIPLANADPIQVLQVLQSLIPSYSGSGSSSLSSSSTTVNQNDILGTRLNTLTQQQNSSQSSSAFGSGFGSSGGRTGN